MKMLAAAVFGTCCKNLLVCLLVVSRFLAVKEKGQKHFLAALNCL